MPKVLPYQLLLYLRISLKRYTANVQHAQTHINAYTVTHTHTYTYTHAHSDIQ